MVAPLTSVPPLRHPGLGKVPPFVGGMFGVHLEEGWGSREQCGCILLVTQVRWAWVDSPQSVLTGPRRGSDSEIRKDCTNPVISFSPFFTPLFYDHAIKCLL